ncbi:MAG: hypothetical protein PHH59_01000 [Methylovulum sp.]|uniref:hypothetical protein n=1 Tax=Methylovulum sp. TaxID=1916980 RepID=UPI00261C0714|nr:hypothetical protein [Methylovulum sp.]MDD2722585.1 hypothetical protein [Methylovulum sp.]MDD5123112.1 hypothetical protein [Methylovulum sp.]
MKKIIATIILSMFPYCAFSGVFQADITVTNLGQPPKTKTFDFDNAGNFFDQLTNKGFSAAFPGYNSVTSSVSAKTVYQGVDINVTLPQGSTNTSELILSIPELGVTKSFIRNKRSDTTQAMEDYLRNDTDHTYSRLLEYQIANTPNSQIAGNPTSLQGQLVGSTFDHAANIPSSSGSSRTNSGTSTKSSSNPTLVGVGGGNYTQKGLDVSVISIPVSKAFGIDSDDPRKKLLINGQFNYITVGEAASFQGSLGLAYMQPITDNWYLIPSVSYGAIGSQDLASLGQIFSTSLSSNYQFKLAGYDMSFVNMFGYYKTLPLSISGVASSDPNINNYVFKNGIFPSKVVPFFFGHDVRIKGIFTDTEFTGSKVFVRQYNEVGIEFSSVKKVAWLDTVSLGLADSFSLSGKYMFSIEDPNNFEGYEIGMGYDF